MDKALKLVSGSFVAAAKLIDMTPQRFRNLVHGHAALAKWRHSKRGRPESIVSFHIEPYDPSCDARRPTPMPTPGGTGFGHVLQIRGVILELPAADRIELGEWLKWLESGSPTSGALAAAPDTASPESRRTDAPKAAAEASSPQGDFRLPRIGFSRARCG